MHYVPHTEDHHPTSLLQRCTGPRSLAWLSSMDNTGKVALSVFHHWQWLSPHSPVLMFSALQSIEGERNRTVENAEQTGWFVWNMPSAELRTAVERCMQPLSDSSDAFQQAGVGKAPSIAAPCPRVAQSPVHLECRYLSTQRLPGHSQGRFVDLVIAEVARVHIKDELLTEPHSEQLGELRTLAHFDDNACEGLCEYPVFRAEETACS
ncbi:MAG: flavin reductase family protein [Granulosicoccaceae bacterium]